MYLAQFISLLMTLPMVSGIKSAPFNDSFNGFQENWISSNWKASSNSYASFYNDLNKYVNSSRHTTYAKGSNKQATLENSEAHFENTHLIDGDTNAQAESSNIGSSSNLFSEASYLEVKEAEIASAPIAAAWPFGEQKFLAAQRTNSATIETDQDGADTPNGYKQPPKRKKQPEKAQLSFDVLYLRPYQGGTDFAQVASPSEIILAQPSFGETQIPYGTNKGLDFDFDLGYRGTIGYQGKDSRQLLQASYLYYSTHASRSLSFPGVIPTSGGVISAQQHVIVSNFFIFNNGFERYAAVAKSDWNLHYNMMDLTFTKKFAQRGCMSFNPFIGVKGILISENQKYAFQILNPFVTPPDHPPTDYMRQKIEVKGAGPSIGFGLDWDITRWLSFTGNIGGAMLASSVNTTRTSSGGAGKGAVAPLFWLGVSEDQIGMPVFDGSFTLRGVYCWKSGRYVDLKVGFEEHYIFRVMKHTTVLSDSSTNLSLMGWFASLGTGF